MRYQDHPTWRMLEESKMGVAALLGDIRKTIEPVPSFLRGELNLKYESIEKQHNKLVKLQLELESKLCQKD